MKCIRKITLLFAVIALFFASVFLLSGCYADPAEVGTWYIEYIARDSERYHCGDEFDGEPLFSDSWVWTFTEDGKVEIVALDGTKVSGTYTAEKKREDAGSLYIIVTLDNGKCFTGWCGRFMFDGSWYEFSLTDGDITVYFEEEYWARYTYQDYLDRLEAQEAQERSLGKLPLEKRENAEDLFYLYSIEKALPSEVFIINDSYNGEILTPKYVVFEVSESGFTADFADGRRITATFVSYEWNAEKGRNVYLAEGEDGVTYTVYYTAEASSDEICRLYFEDATDDVTYVLFTESEFLFPLYLPLEMRSNAGELFYYYCADGDIECDGSWGRNIW